MDERLFARYKLDLSREHTKLTVEAQLVLLRMDTDGGRHTVLLSLLPNVLAYVGRLMGGWDLNPDERMDLVQAGNLGALQALKAFDPDHEDAVYPWTWAKLYVKRQVIREGNLILTGRVAGGDFSFYSVDDDESAKHMTDERLLSPDLEPHERVEHQELLDAIARLDDVSLALVNAVYWEGLTLRDVGTAMGISATAVANRLRSIEKRLRDYFEGRG